jgi:tRNA (guanine6-N2)-methyltransferase
MSTYFATFISGLDEVILGRLRSLPKTAIKAAHDGLVVFSSELPPDEIKRLHCFNNLFLLLDSITSSERGVPLLRSLMRHTSASQIRFPGQPGAWLRGSRNFRIYFSVENELVSVPKPVLQKVEQRFAATVSLPVERMKPDAEFWFVARSEGLGLCGLRLTKLSAENKLRERGELRTELAYALALISEPDASDVICDPFCGHGSIVLQRATLPYQKVYASDLDVELVRTLQGKVSRLPSIEVTRADALRLGLPSGSVDKVITDPPWGLYKEVPDLFDFYRRMLVEFTRILKPGGSICLLTAAKEILDRVVAETARGTLSIEKSYHILVSGKKASIYRIRSSGPPHGTR